MLTLKKTDKKKEEHKLRYHIFKQNSFTDFGMTLSHLISPYIKLSQDLKPKFQSFTEILQYTRKKTRNFLELNSYP